MKWQSRISEVGLQIERWLFFTLSHFALWFYHYVTMGWQLFKFRLVVQCFKMVYLCGLLIQRSYYLLAIGSFLVCLYVNEWCEILPGRALLMLFVYIYDIVCVLKVRFVEFAIQAAIWDQLFCDNEYFKKHTYYERKQSHGRGNITKNKKQTQKVFVSYFRIFSFLVRFG